MTLEARTVLKKSGVRKFGLLERAWEPLRDDLMLSDEELTLVITQYRAMIRSWIQSHRSGDVHQNVSFWVRHNQARLKGMGLEQIIKHEDRRRLDYCDSRQLTAFVCIVFAHVRWKVGELDPTPMAAFDKLADAGYVTDTGGKFEVAQPSHAMNYREAKKARFSAMAEHQRKRDRLREEERLEEEERKNQQATELADKLVDLMHGLAHKLDSGSRRSEHPIFEPVRLTRWQRFVRWCNRLATRLKIRRH